MNSPQRPFPMLSPKVKTTLESVRMASTPNNSPAPPSQLLEEATAARGCTEFALPSHMNHFNLCTTMMTMATLLLLHTPTPTPTLSPLILQHAMRWSPQISFAGGLSRSQRRQLLTLWAGCSPSVAPEARQ